MGSLWVKIKYLKSRPKVTQKSWALVSKQIWSRSFKLGTKHWFWSRDYKDIRGQSWRSKKISAKSADPGHSGLSWAYYKFISVACFLQKTLEKGASGLNLMGFIKFRLEKPLKKWTLEVLASKQYQYISPIARISYNANPLKSQNSR